jgi:dihydrofolate synthase/folylpolyglutamate synthase
MPVVLVAGTNGKGSTAAILAAMTQAAGYRTGLFTSPALETAAEQVRIDGRSLSLAGWEDVVGRIGDAAASALGGMPTTFEALTAAAYLTFARERVDLAVAEVGMGGARDATNAADAVLSLITSLSLEHRDHLGSTLRRIAREKAGIVRAGRPVLLFAPADRRDDDAQRLLAEEALRRGARVHLVGREVAWAREPAATAIWAPQQVGPQPVSLETPVDRYRVDLPLRGGFQVRNLALAVRTAELLAEEGWRRLDRRAIEGGAARVRWPGRLERVALPNGRNVLLDAAHNPAAVRLLAAHLQGTAAVDLLFGVLADKEVERMLPALRARAARLVLTRPPGPRGRDPGSLPPPLRAGAEIEPDPSRALTRLLAGPPDSLAVVTGSLALVGWARRALRERFGVPPPVIESDPQPKAS